MAKEFYTGIDLKSNELKNAAIENAQEGDFLAIVNGVIAPADSRYKIWLDTQMRAGLDAEANQKFTVTTTLNYQNNGHDGKYEADQADSATLDVKVEVKFDGSYVEPTTIAHKVGNGWTAMDKQNLVAGWQKQSTGLYTKSISGASGSVEQLRFTYEPPQASPYYNCNISAKTSSQHSIQVTYPIWYGFADTNTFANNPTVSVGNSFTRRTSSESVNNKVVTNGTGSNKYFWVLTKGSAVVEQLDNVMKPYVEVSVSKDGYTLSGYKLYASVNLFAAGNHSFKTFNIN